MTEDKAKATTALEKAKAKHGDTLIDVNTLLEIAADEQMAQASSSWRVKFDLGAITDAFKKNISAEFESIAKNGKTSFSLSDERIGKIFEPLGKALADEDEKVVLTAVSLDDGSGFIGMDFKDAKVHAIHINQIASYATEAIIAQHEVSSKPDIGELSLEDILADTENAITDEKTAKTEQENIRLAMDCARNAVMSTFSIISKAETFEPGLHNLASADFSDKGELLGVSLFDEKGEQVDFSAVASFLKSPGTYAAQQKPKAVPRKDYTTRGQMIVAGDAEAFSDYIKKAKESNVWGETHEEESTKFLWKASEKGHLGIIKVLLEQTKADMWAKNDSGFSPLMMAAAADQPEVVEYFVTERKADLEDSAGNGMTALMVAAGSGAVKSISKLVELGADINATDIQGRSALHWAAQGDSLEAAKKLIELGVDPSIEEWIDGAVASEYVDEENDELYELIEDARAAHAGKAGMQRKSTPV